MKSAWNEREASDAVERYGAQGVASDLALRVYSTRLLGRDPKLVLHGGGNTSLKAMTRDVAGAAVEVLYVKGSGTDMGVIEPSGFPAVPRLGELRRCLSVARCRASGGGNQKLTPESPPGMEWKARLPFPAPTLHRSQSDDGGLRRERKATACPFKF